MAGALHRQQLRQRVALSDISSDLGLPESAVRELRSLGIRSAEELLGLIYAAFGDVVAELNISPQDLSRISSRLRDYIDPYTLQEMENIHRANSDFPTGAELGPVPNRDKIPYYEEE